MGSVVLTDIGKIELSDELADDLERHFSQVTEQIADNCARGVNLRDEKLAEAASSLCGLADVFARMAKGNVPKKFNPAIFQRGETGREQFLKIKEVNVSVDFWWDGQMWVYDRVVID